MANNFDKILDRCIDRINRGESLEACLTEYPDYVERLESILRAMLQTKTAYSFLPSASAKKTARQHFNAAVAELERKREARRTLFPWPLGWSRTGLAVAAGLLIALIGYFGLRPLLFPVGTLPQPAPLPVTPSPQRSPEGNFVFLISDDVNAIVDFESVTVSISKIGLLPSGDSGQWIEFEPEVEEVDLTRVQGDKTQQIWRGDVAEGQYAKVFIHVADVRGILKETGQEVEIKLPSQKLQISKPFPVTADTVTTFTYDLTVVAAGKSPDGTKYILKPQIGDSGADHKPSDTKGKGKGRASQYETTGRISWTMIYPQPMYGIVEVS